jgi:hypothetical protein
VPQERKKNSFGYRVEEGQIKKKIGVRMGERGVCIVRIGSNQSSLPLLLAKLCLCLRSILIFSSHLCLGIDVVPYLQAFEPKLTCISDLSVTSLSYPLSIC